MYATQIFAAFLVLGLSGIGWIWICVGLRKSGRRKVIGLIAFQISIVTIGYSILRGDILSGFINSIFPPLVFIFEIRRLNQFSDFLAHIVFIPILLGVIALLLSFVSYRTRPWSLAVGGLVALFSAVGTGENASKMMMCSAIDDAEITQIYRNTFLWSLRNTPREFQFEVHAIAELNGQQVAWSYRELNWYAVNDDTWANVDAPLYQCSES